MLNNQYIYYLIIKSFFNNKKDKSDHIAWINNSLSFTCFAFLKIVSTFNNKIKINTDEINKFLDYYNNKSKYSIINLNDIKKINFILANHFKLNSLTPSSDLFRNIVKLSFKLSFSYNNLYIDSDFIANNLLSLNHLTLIHTDEVIPPHTEESITLLLSIPTINSIRLRYAGETTHNEIINSLLPTYCKNIKKLEIIDEYEHSSIIWLLMEQPVPFFNSIKALESLEILKIDIYKYIAFQQLFDNFQIHISHYLQEVTGLKKLSLFKSTPLLSNATLLQSLLQTEESIEDLEIGVRYLTIPIKRNLNRLNINWKSYTDREDIIQSFNYVKDIEMSHQPIFTKNKSDESEFINSLIANNSKSKSISFNLVHPLVLNDQLFNTIKNNSNLQYLYFYGNLIGKHKLNEILNSHKSIRNFYN